MKNLKLTLGSSKNYKFLWVIGLGLSIFGGSCSKKTNPTTSTPTKETVTEKTVIIEPQKINGLPAVGLKGSNLVLPNGQNLAIKGIGFGNGVWTNQLSDVHHNESDYTKVKGMGFNTVRFYLSANFFENYDSPGAVNEKTWAWLDQNVAWAQKHGIYLILNMHIPFGGYQSAGEGDSFWKNVASQKRTAALWTSIASKYANNGTIIGYGLLNDPYPTKSVAQWKQVAQYMTDQIRMVDKNHLIFVEQPVAFKQQVTMDSNLNFPIINDEKVVYEFENYFPAKFTGQLLDYNKFPNGGYYPDETHRFLYQSRWYKSNAHNNKFVPKGNSNWTYYESEKFVTNDPKMKLGFPVLSGLNVGGKATFDDVVIKEFDSNGNFIKEIYRTNFDNKKDWEFWSRDASGVVDSTAGIGRNGTAGLALLGTKSDCNFSNVNSAFEPVMGNSYQISGYIKGENIPAKSQVRLRIDFHTSNYEVGVLNKAMLYSMFKPYINWSKSTGKPIFLGEFGSGNPSYYDNKGGVRWTNDMLEIAMENNIPFSIHAYHDKSFGLFTDPSKLPDDSHLNKAMYELLMIKLK